MKEATGELSMTVITIIAIVAILGIITFLVPMIKNYINDSWTNISTGGPKIGYVEIVEGNVNI